MANTTKEIIKETAKRLNKYNILMTIIEEYDLNFNNKKIGLFIF